MLEIMTTNVVMVRGNIWPTKTSLSMVQTGKVTISTQFAEPFNITWNEEDT